MGIISDVKCSRCDRRYSGLKLKCPYCGTRRTKRGKRVSGAPNPTWKLIVGLLLLAVLIIAVVFLMIKSGDNSSSSSSASSSESSSSSASSTQNDLTSSASSSMSASSSSTVSSSSSTVPAGPVIQTVTITYLGDPRDDITMQVGEALTLGCKTGPDTTTETPVWASSDEDVFVVLQSGKLTAIKAGEAELSVTVAGVTAKCLIRVR